jgi:homoserine O-acetyltransferase/O-succinyltransferase
MTKAFRWVLVAVVALACSIESRAQQPATQEGTFVVHDFHFKSGESLPELKLHYMTMGQPVRDAQGHTTNAVLIMHGTGGSGKNFLAPQFAGELYGPGRPLDTTKYYIILPDAIGHGGSSKPSNGLHAHFPQYEYDDMVAAQHLLLTEGLKVDHLRLVMGTSMGCMHTWVWGTTFPDFMDAMMPLACQPVEITGRNRMWRKMIMDAIRSDPAWKGGEYTEEPKEALRTAADILVIAGSAPLVMQQNLPTRDAVDASIEKSIGGLIAGLDANDLLYQVNSSRNYDPSPRLGLIKAPVMFVNSADDFINPPELGIAQREIKKVKNGKFVLIPASLETHGHGTHTWAALWKQYLVELLDSSKH